MAAKQIIFPAHRAFDSNGAPEAGATASLYLSGTLTPAVFYEDAGLSVSLGSTITANAAGRFDPIPYGDASIGYRLIIQDSEGLELDDIDPFYFGLTQGVDGEVGPAGPQGVAGDVAKAADRTALAAITASAGLTRYLIEADREGTFVFDSSNLSTKVTADTQKGIYIAPASDATGASGAWVRKFNGPMEAHWFGVSPSATAANNYTYIMAAIAVNKARAVTGVGYATGGEELHVRAGNYSLSQTPTWDYAINLKGDYTGLFSGGGTIFNLPNGQDGLYNPKEAAFSRIEGFYIKGASATPGSGKYGLKCRGKVIASRMMIEGFEHGIDCYGNFAGDGTNTNGSTFTNIACQGNVWGTWSDGADANNMKFDTVACISNLLGGHFDSSFLGNIYDGGDLSTNGGINTSTYKNRCHVSGHIYMCLKGQETWCSTNAPTGAISSNQGWLYVAEGTAQTYQPTWTTAQTWYFSAPFAMDPDNNNARSTFSVMYVEPDQNPSVMTWPGVYYRGFDTLPCLYVDGSSYGGQLGGGFPGILSAGSISANSYAVPNKLGIDSSGNVTSYGNTHNFGPTGAMTVADSSFSFHNTNVATNVFFTSGSDNHQDGFFSVVRGNGFYMIASAAGPNIFFRPDGTNTSATMTASALNLATGVALQNNSVPLINGSGVIQAAAMPAHTGDVTSSAGSVALAIANSAVTYAKIQNVSASRLLGNPTGAGAAPSEISLAADHSFTGTSVQLGAFTGDITKSAGSLATTIGNNIVTYAKFQQVAANSLVGNPTGSLANAQGITLAGGLGFSGTTLTAAGALTPTSVASTGGVTSSSATAGIGYATGAGGTVTQATSRTTGVTLNKVCGAITLVSAAGSSTYSTFTVTNSAVAATDTIEVSQKSGANLYNIIVTAVAAGSFNLSVSAVSGTATETPVINFVVTKAVTA